MSWLYLWFTFGVDSLWDELIQAGAVWMVACSNRSDSLCCRTASIAQKVCVAAHEKKGRSLQNGCCKGLCLEF
jgi:hypothetical protein